MCCRPPPGAPRSRWLWPGRTMRSSTCPPRSARRPACFCATSAARWPRPSAPTRRTPPLPTICWTLCAAARWGFGSARRPSPSAPGTSARCSSSRRTASPRRAARGAFRCAAARPARRNPCGSPRRNRPSTASRPASLCLKTTPDRKKRKARRRRPPRNRRPARRIPSPRCPTRSISRQRARRRPKPPARPAAAAASAAPRRRQPRPPSRRSRKKPRPRPRCWTAISRIFPPGWTRWRWPPPARPTINCRPIRPRTWNRRPAVCLNCRTFPPPAKKRPAAPKRTAASPPPRQTTALCRSKTAAWR